MNNLELSKIHAFSNFSHMHNKLDPIFYEENFKYVVLKYYYHYNNFQREYQLLLAHCKKNYVDQAIGDKVSFCWNNNLMYEFDSIYESSFALFDDNMHKDIENELDNELFKSYRRLKSKINKDYVAYHRKIRHDVAHLNETNYCNKSDNKSSRISTGSNGMIVCYSVGSSSIKIISQRVVKKDEMIDFIKAVDDLHRLINELINITYKYLVLNLYGKDFIDNSTCKVKTGYGSISLKDYLV